MDILDLVISDRLRPERKGSVVMYPATVIDQILEWAASQGRRIEWVDGVFYDPISTQGQMTLAHTCERHSSDDADFRATCLRMASEIQVAAQEVGMKGYFEIGISN